MKFYKMKGSRSDGDIIILLQRWYSSLARTHSTLLTHADSLVTSGRVLCVMLKNKQRSALLLRHQWRLLLTKKVVKSNNCILYYYCVHRLFHNFMFSYSISFVKIQAVLMCTVLHCTKVTYGTYRTCSMYLYTYLIKWARTYEFILTSHLVVLRVGRVITKLPRTL